MNKLLVVCAAAGMWLSTAPLDEASAIGTFRLEGPWPSSSAQSKSSNATDFAHWRREQVRHAPLHNHPHQIWNERRDRGIVSQSGRQHPPQSFFPHLFTTDVAGQGNDPNAGMPDHVIAQKPRRQRHG